MQRPERSQAPEIEEPYGWWGLGWDVPSPLSVLDLIAAGNFDAETAALLWLLVEARASIVVAAHPPGAGKTTTLTALSDFLPAGTARIYLRGWNETFAFAGTADPATSYILCNEISSHLPVYLWGRKVEQLFAAVASGFSFGATMHADSPEEVVAILAGYPLYLPIETIAHLDAVLTLAVDYTARRPHRRLDALSLLRRERDSATIRFDTMAWWDMSRSAVAHAPLTAPSALLRRLGLDRAALAAEQARRATYLRALLADGALARTAVRQRLATYDRQVGGDTGKGQA